MSELEILENIGTNAVLELRKQKLASGKSFMINSDDLPAKQTYLEYPDGHIDIVTMRLMNDHSTKSADSLKMKLKQCLKDLNWFD